MSNKKISWRFIAWLITLNLIGIGWFIFDEIEDKRWGRVIVGIINSIYGMVTLWWFQSWKRKSIKKWVCSNCGHIENKEQEIICWKCGKGEMLYRET